ncbi:hypothetical protein FBU59_004923 [Linderina macrospora]|uniref:Uncharacterized protein n=1 Tax=Linderina macrospora TaxID=4868 RepID=A0ACC1J418_9FUNG|nr:hypothetical protein FBU59_004923 [Linderina macrospora]
MAVQQIKNKPVAQVQDIDGEIKPVAHSQSSGKRVASRTMTHVVVQSKDKTAFVIDEDDNNDDAKSSKSDATERAEKADRDEKVDKSSSGPQLDRLGANDSGASSLLSGHGWKLATALLLAASYTGL